MLLKRLENVLRSTVFQHGSSSLNFWAVLTSPHPSRKLCELASNHWTAFSSLTRTTIKGVFAETLMPQSSYVLDLCMSFFTGKFQT